MQTRQLNFTWLATFVFALAQCRPEAAGPGPRAWIDQPLDGSAYSLPVEAILVQGHASDDVGIAETELLVNGASVSRQPNPDPAAPLVMASHAWTPPGEGVYTLAMRAYDAGGLSGISEPVRVFIAGPVTIVSPTAPVLALTPITDTPTATPTRGPSPTPTPTRITPTPTHVTLTPTFTPTPTPTFTPTPTLTPIPQAQVSFSADSTSLIAPQCTTLRWAVENATAVFLNGEGVVGHDTRQVCPAVTTTYTLHVQAPSGDVSQSITINVTVPPTDTPTPTPPPTPPSAPIQLTIASKTCVSPTYSVTLQWIDTANNETGFRVYWQGTLIATLGPNATSFTDNPPLGGPYTYGVEAFNNAGASARPTVNEAGCIF